jgi:hypothetical protein
MKDDIFGHSSAFQTLYQMTIDSRISFLGSKLYVLLTLKLLFPRDPH